MIDGIDKPAADFVDINDRAVRIVECPMGKPRAGGGTDRGQADTALIIRMRWSKCVGIRTKVWSDYL